MAYTMPSMVREIRNLLEDRPLSTQLNGAINASVTTVVVDDARVMRSGIAYEFDDGSGSNAEVMLCQTENAVSVTAVRAWEGTTAATHADNIFVWVDPQYRYNKIALAVNKVLNTDLLPHIYEVQKHEVTTSATTNHYNSPAADCEFILNIYQDLTTSATNAPTYRERFTQYRAVDSDLFSNSKFFTVTGAVQDGTEKLYVNCAHPLAITTLTDPQGMVVEYLAAAHLLEWGEPKTLRDQNERRSKVGDRARLATYFRDEGKSMLRREAARLQKFAPPRKEWLRRR